MANKHVLNPCPNSGKPVSFEEMESAYTVKKSGVLKAFCPKCGDAATVSKKYSTYRKHKARESRTLLDVFNEMAAEVAQITESVDHALI